MNELIDYLPTVKDISCVAGVVGGVVSASVGGIDTMLKVLVVMMVIDYITGLLVAGVFHNSPKTPSGALESNAGFKGLVRKCMILVMVMLGAMLDMMIGTEMFRDMVVSMYAANEAVSITENAVRMNLPVPNAIKKAIEILNQNAEGNDEDDIK